MRFPVSEPSLEGNEERYVHRALRTRWISSQGPCIPEFEKAFAEWCGVRHAVSVSSGTAALHAALLALGLKPGEEVIVPGLSFVSTANAVSYCGATPVFVDVESDTGNIDAAKIEPHVTPRTRGIIPVHLYGHPADMDSIRWIARKYRLWVLEDAAQAHGALYKGRRVGSVADIATFSFYGNKIITTGEGGMVTTDNTALARRVRLFKGQGQDPRRRYWFKVIGHNYRMTNIQAAIGSAQMEKADSLVRRRREIASWYHPCLKKISGLVLPVEKEYARRVWWLYSIRIKKAERSERWRNALMTYLAKAGIETRPFFHPLHTLPPYKKRHFGRGAGLTVTERVARSGISLPTYGRLRQGDVEFISQKIGAFMKTIE